MYTVVLMAAMSTSPAIVDRCGCRCDCRCSCRCSRRCHCRCSCYCHGCCSYVVVQPATMAAVPVPATVVVSLPAEARLTVDGQPTTSTSTQRVFVSPPLEPGVDYFYTLRAEMQRDGQTVATTQRVLVQAGRESAVNLQIPAATVASER